MDWQDDGVEGEDTGLATDKAFTWIREGPPAPPSLQQKRKVQTAEERALKLTAFRQLFDGEPEEARLARAAAAEACWGALSENVKVGATGLGESLHRIWHAAEQCCQSEHRAGQVCSSQRQ